MNTRGFTLLEMTVVMAIGTIIMGVLFTLSLGIGDTAEIQDIQVNGGDEVRRASNELIPRVRQSAASTINWGELPGSTLRFKEVTDLDGNGLAVDTTGNLELASETTVSLDTDDLNNDGIGSTQLIAVRGDTIRVLANYLAPPIEGYVADDDPLTPAPGFWVIPDGNGLTIQLLAEGDSRRGYPIRVVHTEFVVPRN
ncbi:MAG: prepilin-type N-terminal cleavage/methylation domain-containing protein [Candidatus Hydrogenedentes bacterium]|nr:prepilin-type N-terminal cleavage/methylation domain-containing protein [Candidatus Hydrogenedentota bacterium]